MIEAHAEYAEMARIQMMSRDDLEAEAARLQEENERLRSELDEKGRLAVEYILRAETAEARLENLITGE